MIRDLSGFSLEELGEYFSFEKIDKMTEYDLADSIGRDEETGEWFPKDEFNNRLSAEDIKERRLQLKKMVIERERELGVYYDEKDLRELLGNGHYRENKGYNKYGEYCCNKCKQFKPRNVEYYPKDRQRVDGLGYTCRECLKSYSKDYYQRKKEREKEKLKQKSQIRFE